MNTKYLFTLTLFISILFQVIIGAIDFITLFTNVPSKATLLKELLVFEIIVQVIEGIFYIWLYHNFTKVKNITPHRYIDWFITTPTMLVILIFYLIYLKKGSTQQLDFFTLLKENSISITQILLLNWIMLLFGYLGEMKIIPVMLSIFLGFIPFLIYYYMIYVNYLTNNPTGYIYFWSFFIFWSFYGLAAALPYYIKNACYNILDLFAKNLIGLFLSYIIIFKQY